MKIIIYGAGGHGRKIMRLCQEKKIEVIGFVDRNSLEIDSVEGFPVYDIAQGIILMNQYIVALGSTYLDAKEFVESIVGEKYFTITDMLNMEKVYDYNKWPRNMLQEKHITNCKLVVNREKMLEYIPKHGIIGEVGVANGDFSDLLLKILMPTKLFLIDIFWNEEEYQYVLERFHSQIQSGQVVIMKGDSVEQLKLIDNGFFDFVYLDAVHDYDHPKNELSLCKCKVKKDGIIAGHDYTRIDLKEAVQYGVIEAVNEFVFKEDYKMIYLTIENLDKNISYALKKL